MYKQFLAVLLITTQLFSGCNAQNSTVAVSGKLEITEGWKPIVYILQAERLSALAASYQATILDSVVVSAKGFFEINADQLPQSPTLLFLTTQPTNNQYPNALWDEDLTTSNYIPVYYEAGISIHLTSSINNLQRNFHLSKSSFHNNELAQITSIRQQAWEEEKHGYYKPPRKRIYYQSRRRAPDSGQSLWLLPTPPTFSLRLC
ncbi:MAG: hypothetical protein R2795_25050 [Saprospiraceae bacterium]